jgi:excisionase family DNA binding protein
MINVKDTELLQENVLDLISFANEHQFINLDDTANGFVEIFTKGCNGPLTRSELEDLVTGTQSFIQLPVYTTNQAAAWLGVGIDTIREAVWRKKSIWTFKPGHDVLVPHSELVKYLEN